MRELVIKKELDICFKQLPCAVCLVGKWSVQSVRFIRKVEYLGLIPMIVRIYEVLRKFMDSVDHRVGKTLSEFHHVSNLRRAILKLVMLNLVCLVVEFVHKLTFHCHYHCVIVVL